MRALFSDSSKRCPDPLDVHIARRLYLRRRQLGLTQTDIASAIGVRAQQVQKYERAMNRISASTLFKIAEFLEVPVSFFFDVMDRTLLYEIRKAMRAR